MLRSYRLRPRMRDPGPRAGAAQVQKQLGLAADAAAAYKLVTKPKFDQLLSEYAPALRRLAALSAAH
jgi:hypothetical protein